ncbi:hypothetical protein JG688_00011326 [Phytophthora aleatoria]|uniref:Uncharacterized protein n=1 Tax=Phytophthora aleatoria TaxID=2496075 RepID=A0A8J5MF52_9STRA|nr:hypothetical protein JG688_00011326 [Phytophthora aleatoria]
MMMAIFKAQLHEVITCPCGSSTKRWNYAHHCQTNRHKAWTSSMPNSDNGHQWKSKTLSEITKVKGVQDWMNPTWLSRQ